MSLQDAFKCESIVRRIINEQELNGVQFNSRKARRYLLYISAKKQQLYQRIRPLLQLEVDRPFSVPVNKPFLKNGSYNKSAKEWLGADVNLVWGPFSRVRFLEPDIGSRKKLQQQLLKLGWRPRYFTPKGSPKLTKDSQPCDSLNEIDSQVGKDIALWYVLTHRESQIQGWLRVLESDDNPLRSSQRLSQTCFTIGTPTYRFRHKTVVNVPKAAPDVVFGHQMRSLFCVPKGKVMVGFDASGLELRMLAHEINSPDYTKAVIEGKQSEGTDVHTKNMHDAGLHNRDAAKTFIYSFIYGAGDLLIGIGIGTDIGTLKDRFKRREAESVLKYLKNNSIKIGSDFYINIGKDTFTKITIDEAYRALDGKAVKERFLKANPDLERVIKLYQEKAKKGYIEGLDGRRIRMRRDHQGKVQTHKALNTRLQTSGALVMKYTLVNLDKLIRQFGLSSIKVIDMHDEFQYECLPEEADLHGQLCIRAIKMTEKQLNLNCPLDGEYKIGKNWAETH